jgi:hypothetical protein
MFFRNGQPSDDSDKIIRREFPDGLNNALLLAIGEVVKGYPVVDQVTVTVKQAKLTVATITFNIYKGRS